ncbi:hypothetical protein SAMN05421876_102112 [Kaistella jeonii]|nr:hypothetical protein SAMN05421876_102112 [Kaistella jeonii]VEI96396.1 Uncharacterised protein [Kaistella jeonii]
MESLQNLKKEFSDEYRATKKFFEVYPEGKMNMHRTKKA